jgi:hypothetical protein
MENKFQKFIVPAESANKNFFNHKKLIDRLELGVRECQLEKLVENINIPYNYLNEEIRSNLGELVEKVIKPNLQNALRSNQRPKIFTQQIENVLKTVTPEKLSIDSFLNNLKKIYIEKINLQYTISKFLEKVLSNKDILIKQKNSVIIKGTELNNKSLRIEPLYFGYSSRIKDFVDYCDKNFFENSSLTQEEHLMLLTPSQPSHFIRKNNDFLRYKISDKKERKIIENKLIKIYFNNDPLYFKKYLDKLKKEGFVFITDEGERSKIKENLQKEEEYFNLYHNKKLYFLLERHIKYAEEVDELLIIDQCFDKYLEDKLCFLHDLFLKIYLKKWIEGDLNFELNYENIEEIIKTAINFGEDMDSQD